MNRSVEDVIKFMGRTLHLLTLAIGSTVPGTYLADEPLLFTEPFFFVRSKKRAHFEGGVSTSAPSPYFRDGRRKTQGEGVRGCCVVKWISHGMGTALLPVSSCPDLFTRQQALGSSEKHIPLCVSAWPALPLENWCDMVLIEMLVCCKRVDNVEHEH